METNMNRPHAVVPTSIILELHMAAVKNYEDRFLNCDPQVADVYRHIGLYRLFNTPEFNRPSSSWMVQAVLETEIARDGVTINTSEQLDIYVDNFMAKMAAVNNGFEENGDVQRIIQLGFNNLYDAKGFNDE
ncbi:hypothetical protein pEaSNUABM37_00349 [Erwinia phage pEa_SNUABM_37]|nr:hypothetical protein pEaSNUABM37_00349 [Erwinia phage pEa_SNUABM_37]QXO10817.1 hypothetical protein pEaSNUABM48_00349 [Erwinia phage pEa_SNUABM_48]